MLSFSSCHTFLLDRWPHHRRSAVLNWSWCSVELCPYRTPGRGNTHAVTHVSKWLSIQSTEQHRKGVTNWAWLILAMSVSETDLHLISYENKLISLNWFPKWISQFCNLTSLICNKFKISITWIGYVKIQICIIYKMKTNKWKSDCPSSCRKTYTFDFFLNNVFHMW